MSVAYFVVVQGLEGKEKKNYDENQWVVLGGEARKNQKMPYHIQMGIEKKRRKREAKLEAEVGLIKTKCILQAVYSLSW